jgi:hypothetical protein
LNPIQFNAFAIVLILAIMPFAVAYITNAGSDTDGNYIDSMKTGFQTSSGESKWMDNGGSNWSWYYDNLNIYPYSDYEVDCTYVVDGICQGLPTVANNEAPLSASFYGVSWRLPMNSQNVWQTHYQGSDGNSYSGSSGSDIFGWRFGPEYLGNIENNETVDRMRFTFVDTSTAYDCFNNNPFANITFDGEITFEYQGSRLTYTGFEYDTDNKYVYDRYDQMAGTYSLDCVLGFDVEFDFTGFESFEIGDFNEGNWSSTIIEVSLQNFQNDEKTHFGTTALPFAGDNTFSIGIEHQLMDAEEAGFIIRTGTLVLALITTAIALASTPYWNPFKNFFRGI